MTEKHLILATAGHVDHGKSALIKALTGIDPDRLPEEKARGITIDLGFAQLQLGETLLGIIDVPGHEDFVKNMVAGVGAVDLALLVVAADDGWMPQTEEHLQILTYLGVTRLVVALTKVDLIADESTALANIRAQLAETPFAHAPIVSVSTKTGAGLEELKNQLAREGSAILPGRDIEKPRLAVDRAFTLRGIGMVVTGTLTGGTLRAGDAIVVQPYGRVGRIRAVQNHGREIDASEPGMRTALNIPGVDISRGDVITRAEFGSASNVVDVLVTRSARLPRDTPPLKHGTTVRVHHGTAASSARILFTNEQALRAGETAVAELRFERPIYAFIGDRFVLRDSSERNTAAGALVLDADADARKFRDATQQQLLASRAQAPDEAVVFVRTQLQRDHAADRESLLLKSHFSKEEVVGASTDAMIAGNFICDPHWWERIGQHAAALIDNEHKTHPNHIGLQIAHLRQLLATDLIAAELFEALLADLSRHGFVQRNGAMSRVTHRPRLPEPLQPAGSRIRSALNAKPFDPPSIKELAPDPLAQQALRFLRDTGEIVEISAGVVLSRDALDELRAKIRQTLHSNCGATVSELRQVLGSSRRVVVPLLEHLDRAGLTRRVGDKRVLASTR